MKGQITMKKYDFRAWNPQTKNMSYDVTLYANGWTEVVYNSGMSIKHDPTELEILLFSGLHDKNGNKIFEGDILKFDNNSYMYCCKVVFEDGCFLAFNTWDRYNILSSVNETMEVVSNIYEDEENDYYSHWF